MMRRNFAVIAALAASAVTPSTFASAKPDFSGEWKLNLAKSDFGPVPAPAFQTYKIDHQDPLMKVVTNQSAADGDTVVNATYSTDGKETKSDYRGAETRSVANWDGDALLITTKVDSIGATIQATWKLSADGKTILTYTKIATPQGNFDIKSVFDKVR